MSGCPCNSGLDMDACCLPLIKGSVEASSAEALMRSRYTAYVLGEFDYIERTCDPETAEEFNRMDIERCHSDIKWTGLSVREVKGGKEGDTEGTVDFSFSYQYKGQNNAQREIASFRRAGDRWFYVDSEINPKEKPVTVVHTGRNEPCPCGSGKKYKKCCSA